MSPTLVILRPLGLGDFLTGVPAYRALRDAFLDHRIILAASRAYQPLARLTGAIDEVAETRPLQPLPPALHYAEVAVDLHGRGPASQHLLVRSGAERLLSFEHPDVTQTAGFPAWRADEHEVVRWCRMLSEHGIPADPTNLDLARPSARPSVHTTLIHPGAAYPARRWPAERWAVVARAEHEAGRRVLLTGGRKEVGLAHAVARQAGFHDNVQAGDLDLLQLADLVAAAGRVVCGDTGVAHLATAFRTPSVVLFGPTSPAWWGPPPDRPWNRAIWKGRSGDPHGGEPDPGLLEITTEDVIAELRHLDRLTAGGVDAGALAHGR